MTQVTSIAYCKPGANQENKLEPNRLQNWCNG